MTSILAAGVSPELVSFLQDRLEGVKITAAPHGHEALAALAQGGWQLLLLDHQVTDPPALELLATIRTLPIGSHLPVICCLEEGATAELQTTLVRKLGVEQLCYHPLDKEELARQASYRLNLSLRSQPGQQSQEESQMPALLAGLWTRFRETILGRVEVVEQAISALLEGDSMMNSGAGRNRNLTNWQAQWVHLALRRHLGSLVRWSVPSAPGQFWDRHRRCPFLSWLRLFAGNWRADQSASQSSSPRPRAIAVRFCWL